MANSYAMGIDLGGSGIRCLLLNLANGDVQHATRSWTFPKSDDDTGLGYDIDLPLLWNLLGEASREVVSKAGISASDVGSVAVSAMRFTTVIIDAKGEALYATPNRDARASMEYFLLAESHGEQLLQASGLWPLPIQFAPRLTWLKSNRPELLARADCLFSLSDWLNFRLSGVRTTDYSQAGGSGLYDLHKQRWCDELIAELGFDRALFPAVRAAGELLGSLSAEAAAHLGLAESTQLGLGGGDTQCSLLAAGAVNAGDYACVAGTTAPVVAILDKAVVDAEGGCWSGRHLLPDRWLLESSGGPMGETLQWMARLLFPDAPNPELRLFAEAQQSEYGARGMVSSLGAEVMNAKAPSLPAGMLAMTHLSSSDDPNPRRHLCRAVVEGYAAAVRANVERLAGITGADMHSLHLTDGLSRSAVFAQILADFCGRDVNPAAQAMTAANGAALCGAAAVSGQPLAVALKTLSYAYTNKNFKADASGQEQAQAVYTDWCALREASAEKTTPRIADHMLGHVFKPSEAVAPSASAMPGELSALVTAAFDEPSLERLGTAMDVKYASFRDSGRLLTGPDMVKAMQGKQILVTEIDIVDAGALQKLPELRVVAACRSNAVNVDVEACTAFGIPVISAPGRNAFAVADITVAFILAQARKLTAAAEFLKDESVTVGNMGKMGQAFGSLQGNELWHKTIGLIGLGAVGRMVADRLSGFGARIIASDPFATPESAALAGVELVDLDTLLQESDFVSLHAAVVPATLHMISAPQLSLMKPSAFLINTARAALVDESALIDAVTANTIAGAALDTFDEEPPGWDHPLVQHPNVLSTPHVAGNTLEVAAHQGEAVSEALLQLLRGERPRNCLNPEVLADFSFATPRKTVSAAEIEALLAKPPPAVTDLEKNKKPKARSADSAIAASAAPELIEKMQALLAAFCERMAGDDQVAKFSEDKDVCLAFCAPDIATSFYFGLHGGKVTSALGEREEAEVLLTMRTEILDGMFSGSIDTMKAAMNGDISFVGDAAKAMTIQQLSRDMKRLYTGVKDELGDPGDLSSIPQPGQSSNAPAVIVEPQDVRNELVEVVNELYEHYIITATGGNVSVRNPDNPDECWITPSQMFKGDLRPELMVRINLDGKPQDPGSRSPSSEWGFHTQTLRKKKAANAVIHAHAPNATILANCGIPFLPISSDAAFFGDIKRIPFTMPGSNELSELVSDALRDEWAVFMVNHGIVVAGKSLRRACDMAQIIERTAEVILGCYKATGGKPPSVLPDEAVKLFRSMADIIA